MLTFEIDDFVYVLRCVKVFLLLLTLTIADFVYFLKRRQVFILLLTAIVADFMYSVNVTLLRVLVLAFVFAGNQNLNQLSSRFHTCAHSVRYWLCGFLAT